MAKELTSGTAQRVINEVRLFDADLARLFRGLPQTRNIATQCALYIQYLDRAIKRYGNRVSNEVLRKEYLDWMSHEQVKLCYEQLKRLGIIKTERESLVTSKMINVSALVALAESEMIRIQED